MTDVAEANLSAKEMKRKVVFKAQLRRLIHDPAHLATQKLVDNSKIEVIVRVENSEAGYFYEWPVNKFDNRL
jgi:predicted dehydrogenase